MQDSGIEVTLTGENMSTERQKPISEETLKEILSAAMSSPSTGNTQPWQFVLVTDIDLLSEVAAIIPHVSMAKQALAAIVVCGDASHESHVDSWVLDCAGAVQNLLQAAHARGVSTVWTAIYPNVERMASFRRLFNLPDSIMPHTLVPLGYPAEATAPDRQRFEADKVHYNGW